MQILANGQVQRSAAEWSGIIARYRQSGLGMKEFCVQEGLTLAIAVARSQRRRPRGMRIEAGTRCVRVTASRGSASHHYVPCGSMEPRTGLQGIKPGVQRGDELLLPLHGLLHHHVDV